VSTGASLTVYCGRADNGSTNANKFPCPLGTITGSNAGAGTIGGSAVARVAWVKWHNTLLADQSLFPTAQDTASLANWLLEN
ncbi:hypothetical protein, partial [Streptococcus pseudopneumoniae]|uniref:hypothetical protein n=1 Tax=Streptococcus pseudopneumoniae TaxID=257758 RepID=UPI0019D63004